MASKTPTIYLCTDCHGPTDTHNDCYRHGHRVEHCRMSSAIGLVGGVGTGKTVYLAALHDQLMHSAPEWRVSVSDYAFEELTRNYRGMCLGHRPEITRVSGVRPFVVTVHWRGHKLPLLVSDAAGEYFYREFKHIPSHLSQILLFSRSILVTVGLFQKYQGNFDAAVEDEMLGTLFRQILSQKTSLRHVIVLLVGIDMWGNDSKTATVYALQYFASSYRIFTGVLRNAGVRVDPVPLTAVFP